MKFLTFVMLMVLTVACDPYDFGFKRNPAFILDQAFKAVAHLDVEDFNEVAGKEALCVYGNTEGLSLLRAHTHHSVKELDFKHNTLNNTYRVNPKFVGFWSYLNERYLVDVSLKSTKEALIQIVIECDYGVEKNKHPKYVNLKREKYKKKECRMTKIVPKNFTALPLPLKCEILKVSL